jgi:hypothetical protein
MKTTVSMSMIQPRSEIITYIAIGKSDREIAGETHHGRDLTCEVRRGVDSASGLFALKHSLGALRKVNNDLISELAQLTRRSPRLTCIHLADILSASDDFPTVHKSTAHKIRQDLYFIFTPPIIAFPLTPLQKTNSPDLNPIENR